MNFEELSQLIKSRRSVRNWQDKDVPDEVLKQALELATYAPSGMNYQGWKFVVVKNKDMINAIADAVRSRAQKVASWEETARHMENPQAMVERAGFFRKAPVLIAVYSQIYPSSRDQIYLERMAHDEEAALMKSWLDWQIQGYNLLLQALHTSVGSPCTGAGQCVDDRSHAS